MIDDFEIKCGGEYSDVLAFKEVLPNDLKHTVVYNTIGNMVNSDIYIVPKDHYFFLEIIEIVLEIADFFLV